MRLFRQTSNRLSQEKKTHISIPYDYRGKSSQWNTSKPEPVTYKKDFIPLPNGISILVKCPKTNNYNTSHPWNKREDKVTFQWVKRKHLINSNTLSWERQEEISSSWRKIYVYINLRADIMLNGKILLEIRNRTVMLFPLVPLDFLLEAWSGQLGTKKQ